MQSHIAHSSLTHYPLASCSAHVSHVYALPMSREITVIVHEIAEDGLPDMDALTGRVAFLFDGCIVSGWPLDDRYSRAPGLWEADSDVGHGRPFSGVTHWFEFPDDVKV